MGWLSRFWDWIDTRQIDKHVVAICTLYGTWLLTQWSMDFAAHHAGKTGIEIAAVITAVTAPYMALQAAVLKFYFESRATQ